MPDGEIIGGLVLKDILSHQSAGMEITLKNDFYNDHGY